MVVMCATIVHVLKAKSQQLGSVLHPGIKHHTGNDGSVIYPEIKKLQRLQHLKANKNIIVLGLTQSGEVTDNTCFPQPCWKQSTHAVL